MSEADMRVMFVNLDRDLSSALGWHYGADASRAIELVQAVLKETHDRWQQKLAALPLTEKLARWRAEDPAWWATYDETRATTRHCPDPAVHAEHDRCGWGL